MEAATVVDHIIALGLGGTNDADNLISACTPCNSAKAADEARFLSSRYDVADIIRDPALAEWISKARRQDC